MFTFCNFRIPLYCYLLSINSSMFPLRKYFGNDEKRKNKERQWFFSFEFQLALKEMIFLWLSRDLFLFWNELWNFFQIMKLRFGPILSPTNRHGIRILVIFWNYKPAKDIYNFQFEKSVLCSAITTSCCSELQLLLVTWRNPSW